MLYTIRLAREDQNVLDQGGPAGVVVLYILLFVAWTFFFPAEVSERKSLGMVLENHFLGIVLDTFI